MNSEASKYRGVTVLEIMLILKIIFLLYLFLCGFHI